VLERKGAASRKLILVPIFSSQKLQLSAGRGNCKLMDALGLWGSRDKGAGRSEQDSMTAGAGFSLCRAAMAQVVPC
jgi:hypothetical protein